MKTYLTKINLLLLILFTTTNAFANNTYIDSTKKMDSFKTSTEVLSHYETERAIQKSKYVKLKENIAILKYIKTLNWNENEKLEIFNLYKNSYYESLVNDNNQPSEEEKKKIRNKIDNAWSKMQTRVVEIAGEEGAKAFWKKFELITNQFTDITKF